MDFVWDERKNEWLKAERLVSFEETANLVLAGRYIDTVKHPNRSSEPAGTVR